MPLLVPVQGAEVVKSHSRGEVCVRVSSKEAMGIVSLNLAFFIKWQGFVEMALRVTCIVSEAGVTR